MAGLRERKKAKTRQTIQDVALKLFARQGYEATTVDQIADAAEISPSTFFRYFATKEDVVLEDDYDELIIKLFLEQPSTLDPIQAIRKTLREAFATFYLEDRQKLLQRTKLQLSSPSLRARLVATHIGTANRLARAVGQRTGRSGESLEAQAFAAAVIGVMTPALAVWVRSDGREPLPDLADRCLAQLESGFPLGSDIDTTQAA